MKKNWFKLILAIISMVKKYLLLGVLAVLFATPLSTAENAKINLPDGLYMYNSSIEMLTDGRERVGFEKYFVVNNNTIYSAQEAVRKFGVSELNRLFTENKNYKILFGGENIGKIYNVTIDDEGDWNYKDELFTKNIKEGPMYVENMYLRTLGSAMKCIAVPEKYKETPRKVYNTISKEETDKISKLAKDKLFHLVRNRRELMQYNIKETELVNEKMELLDKISHRNHELYIGIYWYVLKTTKDSHRYQIVFSVRQDNVYVITSNYEDETLRHAGVRIHGMLDVDGCGEEELIIEKGYGGLGEAITNIEIYKQKPNGNWTLINKISWKKEL